MIKVNYILPWSLFDGTNSETVSQKQIICTPHTDLRPMVGDTVVFKTHRGWLNEELMEVVKDSEFIVKDVILDPFIEEVTVILFIKISDLVNPIITS